MATGTLPVAPLPAEEPADEAELARLAGIRDLSHDPRRQNLLRTLAKEKAEKRRKLQEEAKRDE
jgi:hypothetical protein